jgi:histone acetyltransferase
MEDHIRILKEMTMEELDRVLGVVLDIEVLLNLTKNCKDDADAKMYTYLIQFLQKNLLRSKLPPLVGDGLTPPPFERPSIKEGLVNFVWTKFGSLPRHEWDANLEAVNLFLKYVNGWKLESPSLHRRSSPEDDPKTYKENYTRWMYFCHVPTQCESFPKYDTASVFGQTLLMSIFKAVTKYHLDKIQQDTDRISADKKHLYCYTLPQFLTQLEPEVLNPSSPFWKVDFQIKSTDRPVPSAMARSPAGSKTPVPSPAGGPGSAGPRVTTELATGSIFQETISGSPMPSVASPFLTLSPATAHSHSPQAASSTLDPPSVGSVTPLHSIGSHHMSVSPGNLVLQRTGSQNTPKPHQPMELDESKPKRPKIEGV